MELSRMATPAAERTATTGRPRRRRWTDGMSSRSRSAATRAAAASDPTSSSSWGGPSRG